MTKDFFFFFEFLDLGVDEPRILYLEIANDWAKLSRSNVEITDEYDVYANLGELNPKLPPVHPKEIVSPL